MSEQPGEFTWPATKVPHNQRKSGRLGEQWVLTLTCGFSNLRRLCRRYPALAL